MSWLKAKDWATGVEYSSLFHSGLRAISLRPRARCARACSPSWSSEESSSGGRTSSVASLSSSLLKRSTTRTRHPSPPTSTQTDSSSAPTPRSRKVVRRRPSTMFVRPSKDSEVSSAWSSAESFSDIGEHTKISDEEYKFLVPQIEIDEVRSPVGSRSFLVNLGERDVIPVAPTKDEPFLLLSSSPDMSLLHPIPRRERPASTQMLPLPSRRTPGPRETGWERGDRAWMLEGSSPEVTVYECGDEEETRPDDEHGDMADWRQFHVDLLQTIR